MCIKCGYFDVVENKCKCDVAITAVYFEASQQRDVRKDSNFYKMIEFSPNDD